MYDLKNLYNFFVRKTSIVLIAIMLGVSNAILEEDRTLRDTSRYLKQTELPANDDPFANS